MNVDIHRLPTRWRRVEAPDEQPSRTPAVKQLAKQYSIGDERELANDIRDPLKYVSADMLGRVLDRQKRYGTSP